MMICLSHEGAGWWAWACLNHGHLWIFTALVWGLELAYNSVVESWGWPGCILTVNLRGPQSQR